MLEDREGWCAVVCRVAKVGHNLGTEQHDEKDIFFGISSKRYCMSSYNFSFFNFNGCSIVLDYCDVEWFALETNRDHSAVFEITSKYCISDSC